MVPIEHKRANSLLPCGYRASGLLLHVSSLPSQFGIGDLGPNAFRWIDLLADASQGWWQMLPLGPTGLGNSPYDPLSTFAGNLQFISPERLVEERLLEWEDFGNDSFTEPKVPFAAVRRFKSRLLHIAWERFHSPRGEPLRERYDRFRAEQKDWLDDFALFIAIKEEQGGQFFYHWPQALKCREPLALQQARHRLDSRIEFVRFCQFLFFDQWDRMRQYALSRHVRLMGDMPFFVSHDSAEVWANAHLFMLNEERHPIVVAGVPPDYFSATGQLWGNPIYDWQAMQREGYAWWLRRLSALLKLVDGVRLDHFRAFAAAWHIPAGAPTAESGEWVPGPAADFLAAAEKSLGGLPFIAEDLGLITEDVRELRDTFELPGMRVLQFAFDGDPDNLFLPHQYVENSVAFTGTHDNDTTRGWYHSLDPATQRHVTSWFDRDLHETEIAHTMLSAVWESASALAIAPFQDVLNLDSTGRMNIPGVADGNWDWRAPSETLDPRTFAPLGELTARTNRDMHA
jgi:4-alpha-glucanotransferase